MKKLTTAAVAVVMTSVALAEDVYRLDATTSSGLDLTAMPGYYADRMEGPASGDITFTGALTVDPAVSASNPFRLIGNGRKITEKNGSSTGFHVIPLMMLNNDGVVGESKLLFNDGAQFNGALLDIGAHNKVQFNYVNNGLEFINAPTAVIHGAGAMLQGHGLDFAQNGQSDVSVTDGGKIQADYWLRLGTQSAAANPAVGVSLGITNATVTVGTSLEVDLNNGKGGLVMMRGVNAANDTENCRVVLGTGGTLKARFVSHHGGGRSTIAFDGGKYTDQGATTAPLFHIYGYNYAGNWPSPWMFVEGHNGNPIDVEISTDRNLAGGLVGGTRQINVTGNGGFTKRGAGALTFNRHNGTYSTCDYTGPTAILGGGIVVADSAFKPGRGALTIEDGAFLDLNGFDVEFADATGAGVVSNGSETVSTLTLGYGDADGVFSAAVGERVNVVKAGTGSLAVSGNAASNSCDLDIEAGTVVFDVKNCSSYGNVTVRSGATLDISKCNFVCANLVREHGGMILRKPGLSIIFR